MKKKQEANKEKKAQVKVRDLQPKKEAKGGKGVVPGSGPNEALTLNHNETMIV